MGKQREHVALIVAVDRQTADRDAGVVLDPDNRVLIGMNLIGVLKVGDEVGLIG
jgi:hypothetical protein